MLVKKWGKIFVPC